MKGLNFIYNNFFVLIKLFIQCNLFIGLSVAMFRLDWVGIFIISTIIIITLLPLKISTRFNVFIPSEIEVMAIAMIYASLYLGEIGDYYEKFWWWDVLLHSSSGFLFGILGFLLIWILNEEPKVFLGLSPFFMSIVSFSFSIVIGVFWEIFEFTMDQLFGMNMQKSGLVDTMWDLIVVCMGAFVVSGFGYFYLRFGFRSIATNWFEHFIKNNPAVFDTPEKGVDASNETDPKTQPLADKSFQQNKGKHEPI